MEKGKFIVLEGIDGCGKSTQTKLLASKLKEKNIVHHITQEHTNGPIGKILNDVYLNGKRKCDERLLNMLFVADRLDHITNEEDGMLKFINSGIHVISDRYYLSSLAYDTYSYLKTNNYYNKFFNILERNKVNRDLLTPDLTIYIDIPVITAMSRIEENRDSISVYEDLNKLTDISTSYKKAIDYLVDFKKENIKIVNGNQEPSMVNNEIWELVNDILYK